VTLWDKMIKWILDLLLSYHTLYTISTRSSSTYNLYYIS
jgi:hypothetical protein